MAPTLPQTHPQAVHIEDDGTTTLVISRKQIVTFDRADARLPQPVRDALDALWHVGPPARAIQVERGVAMPPFMQIMLAGGGTMAPPVPVAQLDLLVAAYDDIHTAVTPPPDPAPDPALSQFPANPVPTLSLRERVAQSRRQAYRDGSDPLYFQMERGEVKKAEWLAKVAEIKASFPYPPDGVP